MPTYAEAARHPGHGTTLPDVGDERIVDGLANPADEHAHGVGHSRERRERGCSTVGDHVVELADVFG